MVPVALMILSFTIGDKSPKQGKEELAMSDNVAPKM